MTVGQLETSMSAGELVEWIAYDRLDPIGGFRQDINTAWLAYLSHGEKHHTVADFLIVDPEPVSEELKEEVERQRMLQKLEQQTAQLQSGFDNVKLKGE